MGRSPLPEQPDGPAPGRRWSTAEEAERAFQARRAQAEQEARQARERDSWYAGAQASNKPQAQGADGRYAVDDGRYVVSDKGGPIRFGDQKQAARWILAEGQRRSPDQFFEIAVHPSGQGFTVREAGRNAGPGGRAASGATGTDGGAAPEGGAPPRRAEPREPLRLQGREGDRARGLNSEGDPVDNRGAPGDRGGVAQTPRAEAAETPRQEAAEPPAQQAREAEAGSEAPDDGVYDRVAEAFHSLVPENVQAIRDAQARLSAAEDAVVADAERVIAAGNRPSRGDRVVSARLERELNEARAAVQEAYRKRSSEGPGERLAAPRNPGDRARGPTIEGDPVAPGDVGQAAVDRMLREHQGTIPNAIHHPELGGIDLVWGRPGPKGNGLAHIAELHPEVLPRLASLVENGKLLADNRPGRAMLRLGDDDAVIALNRAGADRRWVLTAYDRTVPKDVTDARRATADGRAAPYAGADDIPPGPDGANLGAKPPESNGKATLYANPIGDPAAFRRFLADPVAGTIRSLRDALKSSAASVPRNAPDIGTAWRLYADSARATLLHYRNKYSGVKGMADMVEALGATDPGSGQLSRGGYQETADAVSRTMRNRMGNVVGTLAGDAAAMGRVRDILTGQRPQSATAAERTAAARLRGLLDEHHAWLSKRLGSAERELGYVRGRYFPRQFDTHAIQQDVNGFATDAAALYRKMGLRA
jgi:hypothetical protein